MLELMGLQERRGDSGGGTSGTGLTAAWVTSDGGQESIGGAEEFVPSSGWDGSSSYLLKYLLDDQLR